MIMNNNTINNHIGSIGTMLIVTSLLCVVSSSAAFQSVSPSNIRQHSTTTTLNLFGMNKKEEEVIPEEEEEEDLMKKVWKVSKVAVPSFLVGGVATLAFLFLPLITDYHDAFNGARLDGDSDTTSSGKVANNNNKKDTKSVVNNVNQPVLLFETILNDLNEAYVDDVDVQKLFETGVKAMTASLDPYTEFESRLEAQEMQESVSGKYGGVGLVIRGGNNLKELEETVSLQEAGTNNVEKIEAPSSTLKNNDEPSAPPVAIKDAGDNNEKKDDEDLDAIERKRALKKSMDEGIRVVSAFEGYAYDAGMRVGDKIIKIDDFDITPTTAVDEVRNHLRGDPGSPVSVTFEREGVGGKVNEPQSVTLQRSVVKIPDVKYFGFIGDPKDGIGYIDLSGFSGDAGLETRFAISALQHGATEYAASSDAARDDSGMLANDPTNLKGLVLDLRGNPGGLLTSAVDVSTLFVPNGSDIVSARGRGFPETLYRSKTDPILNPSTKLAVLVNEQTASAAEIVTGAIQDLDVGVVVGKGRTFGKGLVQNVQDLPYQTALKYTVAKYYTPSGRCIQSTVYEEGSSADAESGAKFKSKKVEDKDRTVFLTANGREVKDGGGVEVDYKVEPQKASPLEVILLQSGAYSDYAADWSKKHELTDNFKVDEATYQDFTRFVEKRQKDGDIKLEVLYDSQLKELQKKLKASRFDSSRRTLAKLKSDVIADTKKDFTTYKSEIKEDLEQNILARYLPDSMLIERGLKQDKQVVETAKFLKDGREFDKILARDSNKSVEKKAKIGQSFETASALKPVPTLTSSWK